MDDIYDDLNGLQRKLLHGEGDDLAGFAAELDKVSSGLPEKINADPENVAKGLAQLVLTLIELIRQLLERQAMKRIEAGSLSEAEIERLGLTFMRLAERMEELKEAFGLEDEELNLNLGPLGDLM